MKKKLHLFRILCVAFVLLFSFSMKAQNQIALNFDGTDDYIQTDYPGISGSAARTVEFWMNTVYTGTNTHTIISWGGEGTSYDDRGGLFDVVVKDGTIRLLVWWGQVIGDIVVNDGNWHHISVTHDPTIAENKVKIYVDGVLDGQGNADNGGFGVNTDLGIDLRIGQTVKGGNFFQGNVDDVRVWDITRTQAEIQANMNTELCGETPNLMAYFKINDGVAEADNSAITSISGSSVNTYTGTLNNFALTGTTSNFVGGSGVTLCDVSEPCETPTNISVTDIDVDSANINWTENGDATSWTIKYGESGFNVETEGTTQTASTNTGTAITGLDLDTAYDVYIQADCGGGNTSDWSVVTTFTTLAEESCPAPSDFASSNVTSSSVDFTWTENGDADFWAVRHGSPGFTPEDGGTDTADTDGIEGITVGGLDPETTYDFYVVSSCGSGDLSDWTGPITVTTLAETTGGNTIALNFDGTDDYIQTDYPGISGNAVRTIEAWVKLPTTSGTSQKTIVDYGKFGTATRFTFNVLNNKIRIEAQGSGLSGNTDLNDNQWHHVAVTYDSNAANKAKLYVDGELDAEGNLTVNTGTDVDVRIGSRTDIGSSPTSYFAGNIDEVRIWDVALTQAEIQANMNTELCGETPNLMAYFKMNDGVAEADNSAITSISGSSVNTYTGTLNNFALTGTTSNFVGGSGVTLCDVSEPCETPTNISVTDIDVDSANINWTENGDATSWTIKYGESGFNVETEGTTQTASTNTGTAITGLDFDTAYDVYIQADCDGGNTSDWSVVTTFTTLAEESCPGPSGITASNETSSSVDVSWTAEGGSEIFWLLKYGTPGFNPEDEGTQQDSNANNGTTMKVEGLDAETTYDVYVKALCPAGDSSDWVGPVEFTTLAEETCPAPSDFTFSNVTSSSVDFSWTETGDADFWAVRHGVPGFSPETGEGTMTADTDGSEGITIEDLEPESEYDFYVAASCGSDISDWTGPIAVTTLAEEEPCDAIGDFTEDFDASEEVPNCWNSLKVNSTGSAATIQVTGSGPSLEDPYSSPNHVRMFNQLGGSAEFYLITPELNNLNTADHQLRFLLFGNPTVTIDVGTMSDPEDGSTFTTVETLPTTPEAYQEYIVLFDGNYTNQHIAIKATYTATFKNVYIDNVNWEPIPSCPKPINLVAENITANSADLSWTSTGTETEWEIIYGEAGFDLEGGDGTTVSDNNDLGETIQGLSIGTDYDFYVKAICGDDDESEWSFIGTFTTLCDVYPLDYTEDFESYIPNCWEEADSGNTVEGPSAFGNSNWTATDFLNNTENGKATKIILYGNSISDWLISPEIDLSVAAELTYDVGVTILNGTTGPDNIGEDDQVQVLITTDGGVTWENLMTYDQSNIPSATGDTETIDLSAYMGIIQIAFWATDGAINDGDSYDFFIDDLEITVNEEFCEAPTNVEVFPETGNTAMVTWTENGDATEWEILYGEAGFTPGDGTGTSIVDNDGTIGETITGLTEGTDYDVYVRALCDEDNLSEWSVKVTFASLSLVSENFKSFKFYPNPVKDKLHLQANSIIEQLTVYNLLGQIVIDQQPNTLTTRLDLTSLQSGAFLMKVNVKGTVKTFKLIKK